MSTTTTGADPGPTPRRARFARPFRRRPDAGTSAARGVPSPTRPQRRPYSVEDPDQRRLMAEARRRGAKAAKNGVLDPWVLASGDRVPYFAQLAAVRDLVRSRLSADAAEEAARAHTEKANAVSAAAGHEQEVRRIEDQLAESAGWLRTNRSQLDRLAARAVRWERFRDGVREQLEERWLRARFGHIDPDPDRAEGTDGRARGDADGRGSGAPGAAPRKAGAEDPDHPHGDGADDADDGRGAPDVPALGPEDEDWQSVDPSPAAASAAGVGSRRDPADPRAAYRHADQQLQGEEALLWEGLSTRPGLPRWMVWALLLVIAAVEVPIYWIAFQPFHGAGSTESDTLSGTLAISAALVMVVVPHLAGRALRSRSGTASAMGIGLPAVALLTAWGFSAWALGDLRSKLVFRHRAPQPLSPDLAGVAGIGELQPPPTLVDSLHLEPTTVTWMFVALLLLSGGIGLLLGLLREHPYLDSYRSHLELRARLVHAREAAAAAMGRARALESTADARAELREHALNARLRSTTDLYEAAAHAFLQEVMEKAADPAVTESAMRLSSRTWPLLPATPATP
ncbi:hypothetical protein ACIQWR_31630 [Streptomyces sp. NPDC098789]|uniref:hypothetical protein n=1 Tax=Streptomyces sp. NPDC098789 TaxID=3366098 RepID=UPI003818C4FF